MPNTKSTILVTLHQQTLYILPFVNHKACDIRLQLSSANQKWSLSKLLAPLLLIGNALSESAALMPLWNIILLRCQAKSNSYSCVLCCFSQVYSTVQFLSFCHIWEFLILMRAPCYFTWECIVDALQFITSCHSRWGM
jgi:hypothetical protein